MISGEIISGARRVPVDILGEWRTVASIWAPRRWEGLAVSSEPIVAVFFMQIDTQITWCISGIGAGDNLPMLVGLSNTDCNVAVDMQVDANNLRGCAVLPSPGYLPPLPERAACHTGEIVPLCRVGSTPGINIHALFFVRHDVKCSKKRIWHPRKSLLETAPPYLVTVLSHGRHGRFQLPESMSAH